ncbi:hypothetical protein A0H81_01351 [Grifola frondosa]|uniref:Uncharacterized protein n=1 Tax=Grifola frondosa TaxID=5627 RepID=A0A1C7MPN8_GRIFR|nr:hypothetical protein A0H81_01351 [Grifola frondosa]
MQDGRPSQLQGTEAHRPRSAFHAEAVFSVANGQLWQDLDRAVDAYHDCIEFTLDAQWKACSSAKPKLSSEAKIAGEEWRIPPASYHQRACDHIYFTGLTFLPQSAARNINLSGGSAMWPTTHRSSDRATVPKRIRTGTYTLREPDDGAISILGLYQANSKNSDRD